MTKTELKKILRLHQLWLNGDPKGVRANLSNANLRGADLFKANLSDANLSSADLFKANLRGADLFKANLSDANLPYADLFEANLFEANLSNANLFKANLSDANLPYADLFEANLSDANLSEANLTEANLTEANLFKANLYKADLTEANLSEVKGLIKTIGIEIGNVYWKHFDEGLKNNNFQFKLGLNVLPKDQKFNDNERELCGHPGFHFAIKSWCIKNDFGRHLIAKIRIPKGAKICEPWATDGKARADKIEILAIYDTRTGKNITYRFRK